jgi:hypothetical protein
MKKVLITNLSPIFSKIKVNDEFEVSFGGYKKENEITLQQFLNALNYCNGRAQRDKLKLEVTNTLDINYLHEQGNIYRISINDIDYLNQLMPSISNRKNHVIFSILAGNDKLEVIRKYREKNNRVDIDEYDIRARLSTESVIDKKEKEKLLLLPETERFNMTYRYKQRTSVYIMDDNVGTLKLEVSLIKQSNNINKVQDDIREKYEVELEYMPKKIDNKYIERFVEEIENIKKAVYQNIYPTDNTTNQKVIHAYKELLFSDIEDKSNIKSLYLAQPITTEIQNITDNIPAKYTVTDKADGDRHHLFINDSKVYLITINLEVKYTNIEVDKKYNKTVIDGEYIFVAEKQKFVFLGFDMLYSCGNEIKEQVQLKERLEEMYKIIRECFGNKYKEKEYKGTFEISKLNKHYEQDIKEYIMDIIDTLNKTKEKIIIKAKYYIFPLGGHDCEIFNYTEIMWQILHNNKYNLELPYYLDGIIYTPIEQKFTRYVKDTKQFTYKWKPSNLTSIDMYITFEKDRENGKILNLFDNSGIEEIEVGETETKDESYVKVKNKVYRVCNLNVGRTIDNVERPVPFKKGENLHQCHLYLEDNLVRDLEGEAINDETVVEFYYNDDLNIDEKNRWVPIRTRHEKTDSVRKYGMKYGNNEEIANKIWRAIRNKITIEDLKILGDPKKYDEYITVLRNRIDRSVIANERIQNTYYQLITKLGKPQRDFHNWIKNNMIYTYCSKKILPNKQSKQMSVLDIGIGRGGDIMKFYHPRINYLVGIDIDANGLHFATDGALSRYENFRKKNPNFPKMYFIQADATIALKPKEQEKAISKMTDENSKLIEEHFGEKRKKFDVINCQFAIHYMFRDEISLNNFCENINEYLQKDGFMLVSTFDGGLVYDKLKKENGKHTIYYTTEEGNKKVFHELIQRYKTENIKQTGLMIDMFNCEFMNEGEVYPEYLVDSEYLVETMYKKCGLVLIESETFENVYKVYKNFFTETYKNDSSEESRKFFADVAKFYDETNDMNKATLEITKMNRYYIFQKMN